MKVLFLDGYNLIYRARYSFQRGEHACIYAFFRSLRPIIEKFDPDIAYFAIEGYPKARMELLGEYKANRVYDDSDNFHFQKREIIRIIKQYFPVTVVRHPDFEGDDVIANLISHHPDDECVVVSTDTDFIQLLNKHDNVKLYNPIKKSFVPMPAFDYVKWKALRGDSSDNITGIRGIGDKRATRLVVTPGMLDEFLASDTKKNDTFLLNCRLISFENIDVDTLEIGTGTPDWLGVLSEFNKMNFSSITNEKSWLRFTTTFSRLENNVKLDGGGCRDGKSTGT